jgi:ankyrin repeat protein
MVIRSTLRALARLSTALLMTAFATHAANESDQSMTEELIAAAERGETSRVREILTEQPNLLNVAGANSNPLLFAAAGKSQLETVRLLVELGVDLNAENGSTARVLHHCAWMGSDPAMFDLLIEHGADPAYRTIPAQWTAGGQSMGTPLDVAFAQRHDDLVTALRERGLRFAAEVDGFADADDVMLWHRAFLDNDMPTLRGLLEVNPKLARAQTVSHSVYLGSDGLMHGFGLYLASVHVDDPALVRLLAESGGVPLRNGWDVGTPWPGHSVAVTEVLLDVGFQINTPNFGNTDDETFTFIVDSGVDLNTRWPGSGLTWLHGAVADGTQIMRVFSAIRSGADVNILTHSGLDDEPMIDAGPELGGQTPLHIAARAGNLPMVRLLLRQGADPTIRTLSRRTDPKQMTPWPEDGFLWWSRDPQRFWYEAYDGETPADLALKFGHDRCAALLEEAAIRDAETSQ